MSNKCFRRACIPCATESEVSGLALVRFADVVSPGRRLCLQPFSIVYQAVRNALEVSAREPSPINQPAQIEPHESCHSLHRSGLCNNGGFTRAANYARNDRSASGNTAFTAAPPPRDARDTSCCYIARSRFDAPRFLQRDRSHGEIFYSGQHAGSRGIHPR